MTLLELACDFPATIVAVTASREEEQRLHAIGVYVGSTIKKLQHSPYSTQQPICIATDVNSTFAISQNLAAAIHISLNEIFTQVSGS